MTHLDDRLHASLDGIEFYFREVKSTPGRRTHVHDYYGGETPWVEDIGKAAYRLNADVFLIGPEYNRVRDDLRDVLDSPGPYTFVDPYRGPILVRLDGQPTLSETIQKDGMVQIGSLSLVEAGSQTPTIYVSTKGKLSQLAGLALEALALNTTFSIKGATPGIPSADSTLGIDTILGKIIAALNKAASFIRGLNGKVNGKLGQIAALGAALDRLVSEVNTLLDTPQALMGTLNGLVFSLMNAIKLFEPLRVTVEVEDPIYPVVETGAEVIRDLVRFEVAPEDAAYVPEGPQRAIEAAALAEVTLQMRAAGVISGADMVGQLPFKSGLQAVAMMEQLTAGFDIVLNNPTLPAETYEPVAALKSATTSYLLEQAAKLPQIETVVLQVQQPALVLAWHLYGDPARAREIGLRNGIAHHGFLPPFVPLEVISDA